jgi:hypothetical protein
METFMWVFGIVLFIVSCLQLLAALYMQFDNEAEKRRKVMKELVERAEPDDRLQTNLILESFNSNVLTLGMLLISLLGIFFGSVIIYLYK